MSELQANEKLMNAHHDRGVFRKRIQIINYVGVTAAFVVIIGALDHALSPFATIGLRFSPAVELVGRNLVQVLFVVIMFHIGTEIIFAKRIIEAERVLARPSIPVPKNRFAKIAELFRNIRT